MSKQVWDSKISLLAGDVVYTHLYVYVDPSKVQGTGLQNAFSFQADVRAGGADVFTTGEVPLKNGPITAKPSISGADTLGSVQGEIDDWNASSGSWDKATSVHFLIIAKSDVSVPIQEIVRLVPAVGPLIGGVLGLFGKVRVTVGHENVLIPIARDGSGRVVSVNHVPIP